MPRRRTGRANCCVHADNTARYLFGALCHPLDAVIENLSPATKGPERKMTPEQKTLVKDTWSKVVPIADTAATMFYNRLFEIDASTRALFRTVDMAEQRRKLVQALATVINGLDNLAPLVPVLENLGRSHVRYGVTDKHYDSVGAALLWTLEQGLKDVWTPAVKDAWTAAYGAVAGVMLGAARQAKPAH